MLRWPPNEARTACEGVQAHRHDPARPGLRVSELCQPYLVLHRKVGFFARVPNKGTEFPNPPPLRTKTPELRRQQAHLVDGDTQSEDGSYLQTQGFTKIGDPQYRAQIVGFPE